MKDLVRVTAKIQFLNIQYDLEVTEFDKFLDEVIGHFYWQEKRLFLKV